MFCAKRTTGVNWLCCVTLCQNRRVPRRLGLWDFVSTCDETVQASDWCVSLLLSTNKRCKLMCNSITSQPLVHLSFPAVQRSTQTNCKWSWSALQAEVFCKSKVLASHEPKNWMLKGFHLTFTSRTNVCGTHVERFKWLRLQLLCVHESVIATKAVNFSSTLHGNGSPFSVGSTQNEMESKFHCSLVCIMQLCVGDNLSHSVDSSSCKYNELSTSSVWLASWSFQSSPSVITSHCHKRHTAGNASLPCSKQVVSHNLGPFGGTRESPEQKFLVLLPLAELFLLLRRRYFSNHSTRKDGHARSFM